MYNLQVSIHVPVQIIPTCSGDRQFCCYCLMHALNVFFVLGMIECLSSPCQNGGVCDVDVSGYTCQCDRNYVGTNCETGALSSGRQWGRNEFIHEQIVDYIVCDLGVSSSSGEHACCCVHERTLSGGHSNHGKKCTLIIICPQLASTRSPRWLV